MSKPPDRPEFVRKIFEEGVRWMEQLLEENERLRLELARARDQQRERAASVEEVSRVRDQLRLALEDATDARQQLEALRAELDRVSAENREFADACVSLQEKQAALSSLYAASYELHASLDQKAVLETLSEITINLLGSESFAIYLVADRANVLQLAFEFEAPALAPRTLEPGHGVIGRALADDAPWLENGQPSPGEPVVVVALRTRGRVVGALAIFQFLAQKKEITELDRELFRLLSAQAATALDGASNFAKEARRAATLAGLVDLFRAPSTER